MTKKEGGAPVTILIFSDSHGNKTRMIDAAKRFSPDAIFHLGDHASDAAVLRDIAPLYVVRGNCDFSGAPDERTVEIGGKRFFLTHGHRYGVKAGTGRLRDLADENAFSAILYGHTHLPNYEFHGRTLLLCPGAVCGSRMTGVPNAALLEWRPGKDIYMTILEL